MRVSNDAEEPTRGPFAEFLRLQTDFQARLAEETLRYLRRLQGTIGPSVPGTFVIPADGLEIVASGEPGGSVVLELEIENLQRVHCVITPQLTAFVAANGTTWFPTIDEGFGSRLVPPGAVERIAIALSVPEALPPATYRAALLLPAFREGAVAVKVIIGGGDKTAQPQSSAQKPKRKPAAKRRKRSGA
jgi:hypothetical protein